MRYERTFHIQSAHLNSLHDYETVWWLATRPTGTIDTEAILTAMRNTHGHNYKIKLWVEGALREGQPWLIDDPQLEKAVNYFHNTNLSLLPYFMANQKRATTEELALLMWGNLEVVAAEDNCHIARIEVWESDDICASFEPATDKFVTRGAADKRMTKQS